MVCKTRVAPLKAPSILRLELLSALLLARILSNVSDSLKGRLLLQPPKCFTDSRVALYWITGLEKEWRPFVQNRVNEIREVVPHRCQPSRFRRDSPAFWCFVPLSRFNSPLSRFFSSQSCSLQKYMFCL